MTVSLFAVKERVKAIIANDLTYATVETIEPDAIQNAATCVLFAYIANENLKSGEDGIAIINVDCYWYLRGVQETLKTIRQFELDGVQQDFITAFMSRPRLQLNDNGLANVKGDISIQPALRNPSQVLYYPIGFTGGIPYRGFMSRLIVNYYSTYPMRD